MIISMEIRKFFLAAILAASAWTLPAATDPPIACNMKALTSEQRKQLGQLGERVISAITSTRELNDGYAFRVDPAKASLMDVAQWLDGGDGSALSTSSRSITVPRMATSGCP